jgi:hypothetical protein
MIIDDNDGQVLQAQSQNRYCVMYDGGRIRIKQQISTMGTTCGSASESTVSKTLSKYLPNVQYVCLAKHRVKRDDGVFTSAVSTRHER